MKKIVLLLLCLNVIGCTQSKQQHAAVCQQLAEKFLESQAVGTYYLIKTQQDQQGLRLFYRLQQSYKITQTEPRIFQCIEKPQLTLLNEVQGGLITTRLVLPKQKNSPHGAG